MGPEGRRDRVRITAQLIHGASDEHLWANDYEGDLTDILSLQKTVARAIADEIKIAVTPEEEARLSSVRQVNPEAYELYFRGRYHFDKWTKEGFERAIEYFQQAIEVDPNYAQVYAWLSDSYGWLWLVGVLPPEEYSSRSTVLIKKALEIDDALPEAHLALAEKRLYLEWDWKSAETEFKRAIDLNPNFARAHQDYAWHLMAMGRFAEAKAEAKRGHQLDPFSYPANETMGMVYYYARTTRQ
ncbi:MAG: hypothetical protein GH143_00655 [Calditrichaeota bacterium]|nr:hypothetical protein [Calditrichota bacterium]